MSNKLVTLAEYNRKTQEVQETLDKKGCVELKQVFFDSILWTTVKAICLKKADKKAWVARKVIAEINVAEDDVCDIWIPTWVNVNWSCDNE